MWTHIVGRLATDMMALMQTNLHPIFADCRFSFVTSTHMGSLRIARNACTINAANC